MRDLIITLIVVAALPLALARPWTGIITFSWLSYMNPHRMAWGFAYNMPFAQLVALATIAGLVFHKGPKSLPRGALLWVWVALIAWMTVTFLFAIDMSGAQPQWQRVMKIQFVAFLTLMLIRDRAQFTALMWVTALSLGFFGLKGGLFALRVGGEHRVWGPPESIIADNNALAVALLMTIPLLRALQLQATNKYVRWGLIGMMGASALSILSSQSRGALLGSVAMLGFMVMRSTYKLRLTLAAIALVPALLMFMPQSWYDRMSTLQTYQEDNSAMGRLTAWEFATDMGTGRLTGGGFQAFNEANYRRFSPDIAAQIVVRDGRFQDAHSIYFQMLGEHGVPGLALFLTLLFGGMVVAAGVARRCKGRPDLLWAAEAGSMLQVCFISFAVGGAFLDLAYFDLFYNLVGMTLILRRCVDNLPQTAAANTPAAAPEALPVRRNIYAAQRRA